MPHVLSRRQVFQALGALGVGSAVFQRALAVQAEQAQGVTPEMIKQAEWIAGIELSEEDRKTTAQAVNQAVRDAQTLRKIKLENSVAPALIFRPLAGPGPDGEAGRGQASFARPKTAARPESAEDLAFLTVGELASLVQARQVSSVELTRLYLERLKKFDPVLRCVVSLTEELALQQAEQADREIAAGKYRGPLHGIPWGAKDLIAFPGYKTTWGALPFKEQTINAKATVARRLEEAGAVLVAKLTLGALAMGDRWFGGMTRSPWNPKNGSSGSSAGSASATAAGLVPFGIGTETLGSIVSPCRVCGTTGLRPTFGRVSRHGCMALAWSMDKVGPITRSVEDCAIVFAAIHGADGLDLAAVTRPFHWPYQGDLRTLKVGYFGKDGDAMDRPELAVLRELGVQLVPIQLPEKLPVGALRQILNVESATAFDELTRQGITEGLNTWPRTFRQGRFITAVEYLRANRVRTLLMHEMEELMAKVDLYVGGNDLLITNLTGHPTVVMPNGFRKQGDWELPTSITFTGRLYGETELLAVANAYQQAAGHHRKRPPMDRLTPENAG
jgi:Asp-tRNA(Asn)/Glu-tRNA(Gln) amidotransferase A subunit family amidase